MSISALLALSNGAQAGMFDDDVARGQIAQLQREVQTQRQLVDQRLLELENIAKSRSLIDLFNQLEVLKVEVAKLKGMQEVLSNELDNAQKRQRDLYEDSDTRIRKLESTQQQLIEQNRAMAQSIEQMRVEMAKAAAAVAAAQAPVASNVPPALDPAQPPSTPPSDALAEQRAFDTALNDFRAARYSAAVSGFSSFVRAYPRSGLAPTAQYWLGNSLYATKDFRGAISAQRQLIAQNPDHSRVPDALFNIGSAFAELDDQREAKRAWQDVVAKYPQSEAANRARARLK